MLDRKGLAFPGSLSFNRIKNQFMNENKTTEFSFMLKPSKHGIGVFVTHDVKKDTFLRLFGSGGLDNVKNRSRELNKDEVPEVMQNYCIERDNNKLMCPQDFSCMHVGWYLNHSSEPNAYHIDYNWYAKRDIKAYEEILIDYNSLEEPKETKDEYYYGT